MRKLILLSIITATVLQTSAQVSFGPKAGLNLAKLSFSNENYKTNFKPSFFVGGFANYSLNPTMALQAEIVLSGEGTKEKLTSGASSGKISEMYLHIPVLFQYITSSGFYGEAGPQIGLLLSSKETWNGQENDIKKNYKSTDIRFPLGVGYRFADNLGGLAVNLRYSFSFSEINKVSVGGSKLKNQVISIGAQYTLASKKK